MAPHSQNVFTTHAVRTQFFKQKYVNVTVFCKNYVLLIFNETTRGRVLIFFHWFVLAMKND